jgi:hypothetical protein
VTADPPIPLVWLEAAGPDADQSRALTGWARARGAELVLPSDEKPRAVALDARSTVDLADEVERLLDRVRDAIAGRDGEAADGGLAAAESLLRAHPELPQASWLMAEVERGRSSRFRRVQPLDGEAAERAWMRAEALDGGRVPGVGERSTAKSPAGATLALDPLPTKATLRLDGRLQPAGATVVATHAGPHALVVTWNDVSVWAGWIDAPTGSSALHLTLPAPPPCSNGDVEAAHLVDGDSGAVDATGVRCAFWVAARSGPRAASVRVALCEMDRCGSLVEWIAPSPASWTWSPAPERAPGRWPSWATWGLVGAGAVIVTGVVVVASGILQAAPTEMRFVSGGVKAQ